MELPPQLREDARESRVTLMPPLMPPVLYAPGLRWCYERSRPRRAYGPRNPSPPGAPGRIAQRKSTGLLSRRSRDRAPLRPHAILQVLWVDGSLTCPNAAPCGSRFLLRTAQGGMQEFARESRGTLFKR